MLGWVLFRSIIPHDVKTCGSGHVWCLSTLFSGLPLLFQAVTELTTLPCVYIRKALHAIVSWYPHIDAPSSRRHRFTQTLELRGITRHAGLHQLSRGGGRGGRVILRSSRVWGVNSSKRCRLVVDAEGEKTERGQGVPVKTGFTGSP